MTIDFITQEKDYWVASNAINITLNALSNPNRIQCSVSSGAVVRCFYEHIDEADSLGYTVAHDYHQWPISSSPTYFNSNTEKYVYIAIPRSAAVGVQAIVVFPSDKLDIYGRKAVKSTDPETGEETIVYEQIGSTDYFYVWLQATISAPLLIDGVLQRIWTTQIATGKLDTPQGDAERETDSEWYLWSAIGGFVTFLREIRMSVDSWFANIRLGKDKRELTGVATADTPDEFVDSETLVVTPSYLSNKFLRKDMDDSTPYSLGVGEDLTVGGDVDVTGQERVDVVQSHNYSGSGLADTGFLITNDNGSGDSLGVFDYLTVRKKMIINSLEIKETHFSAGDVAHTLASAEIARTDYFYVDEEGNRELLGYSTILVPWSLKGGLLALAKGNLKGIFGHYKKVRLTLTQSQLERCNRIRCYFLAKDGEREIENWFRANDLVRCQTWNVLKTKRETFIPNLEEHDGNVYWWRKVHDVSWNTGVTRYVAKDAQGNPTGSPTTNPANAYVNEGGVKRLYDNGIYHTKGTEGYDDHQPVTIDGNTYHWFDVAFGYNAERSGEANWCDMGSDLPAAGDKVIQFGNTTDPDRMNIFMIEVNGSGNPDAPDWKMYRGVYTFNLTNCWWGGESCRKTKWSVATGIEAYAPQFNWITEYGIARQVFVRDEVYWNKIPFERDDDWSKAISSYPDYSDDIVDANGRFVSRADGSPKNYVRKCRYYEQVSHNGSAWLCSVAESFYWRSADGRKLPAKTDGAEYVRNYTYDEPSAESNNWTEQVEKGDPGAFKSSVFCRTNKDISAYQPQGGTYDNPIPTSTRNAQGVVDSSIVWTDGIPAGDAMLWETTAWFYSNADPAPWTTPRQQTDNETIDIEFSPNSIQPSDPVGTATNKDTAAIKTQRHNQGGENMGWFDPNDTLTGWTWSDMKWRAERKIKNGEYYGSWAVSRIKGENSVRIDLDNENDSMLYTSGGKLVSGNVLSTARLFDGATDVSTSATWTMTAVGCTMSSGNSRNIVVTGMTASTGYVNVQAVYTDKNGTVYTKTARLTLKKLVDVDKYDLDITPNSIAYNATKDQPETSVLTIKVWKMTVDGNRVLSNPPSGYGVYVNNAKQTASSTGTYSYTTDNSAISSVQVKIAKDADLDAILDSETIPVNKAEDGAPGTSPYFADIDNEMDSVACDKNGKTLTAYDTTIGVSLWHGSHPLDITTLTTDSIQGFTITPNKSARTIRIQVAKDTSIAEVNKIGITIAGSGSGNLPLHFVLNGVRQGENGEPAVLYSLIPSVSSVVRKKDGTYSVDNVSCTRQKNVGGTITNDTTDGAITYKLDGGTEKAYTNNTDIAVTSFTKSIQFIFKVDGKVVDIETIPMVADGEDGVTPTVEIVGGYWVINGQSTGVKAEGTDGTGVEIKGTVANPSKMTIRDDKGYATPMNSDGSDAPEVEVKHGNCYICNSDRHLYMFTNTPAVAWSDLGEFQGEPGKNSYMHIAYAKKNPLNVSTSTVDTIGFTVNSDGSQYEWMGFCTDDKESDPGRNWSSLSPSQKVAAVNAYKWNYMKGKDGSGYEYIYLLTKEGFKPTIDESSGQGSQSDDEFYPSVGNYQDGKIYDNSRYWNDDPPADISETWPVLWWASRKKSDGVWQAFGSVDLHNRYAKDGTSPWIADLDNEMDSVACDNDGKPVVQQAVSTNVSLFYGSQKKAFITSVNGGDTGITISFSNKTAATAKDSDTVTVTFATNAVISGKKEFEITLTAKDDASIQRVLTLTVNGLKGGATYNLVPSDSFVLLNKANQYVPNVLTCTYNKFDVAKGQFVTPSGGTVKYIKDGETAENAYKQLVPGTDFTNNVTFLLYVGTTLVDRETIHIVKDGTDGLSAQSYIETQEAWSNQENTASADTMPSDCQEGDWKDSTPANTNSRTYLWRRSRKMTLKTDKSGYDAGQWSYTRLSGTNGTSIKTQGTVANTSKLLDRQVIPLVNGSDGQRTDVQDGWAYISEADRHLYQWSDELRSKSSTWVDWRSGWLDLGEFKGESGKTYYTHIAWAKGIILKKDGDGRAVTTDRTAGQRTMPNAVYPMTAAEQALFDFSIAPQEDLTWMGTLVDEDTTDAADYKYYTWKYVQGADGDSVTMTEHWVRYAAQRSEDYTGVHPATTAFSNDFPSIPEGGYLWTWTHEKYSNGVENDAYSVSRVGIDGDGVKSSEVKYCQKQNTNTAPEDFPESDWGDYPTHLNQGWWLYTRTIIIYSNNQRAVSYSSSQIGTGSHYAGVVEYYAIGDSDTTPPTGAPAAKTYIEGETISIGQLWQQGARPNNDPAKPYLWNFEISSDSQGTRYVTSPVCIGNWSRGIAAIIELYAISSEHVLSDAVKALNWTDEQQDAAPTNEKPYQWNKTIVAYNDSKKDSSADTWDDTTCDVHYHISAVKGANGKNGGTPEYRYQWNQSADTAPQYAASAQNPGNDWKTQAPNRPTTAGVHYLWCISAIKQANGTYGTWGNAIRLTGDTGTPGEDAKEREWIYKVSDTNPGTPASSGSGKVDGQTKPYDATLDDWVPDGWTDDPKGVTSTNKTEYASWRIYDKTTKRWGAFNYPIIWSHYGERGMDGAGMEYVFIRTATNVAPTITNSGDTYAGKTYLDDEYLPLSSAGRCTDDPVGTSHDLPYEWVCKRTKGSPNAETGVRQWEKYSGAMALWANYSEDGQSTFKSHVFKRQAEQPAAPTGGSYSQPVPSGWSDGVPDGTLPVWMSTRVFTSDGKAPQQTAWTTPRQMTDTADFDVEFSSVDTPNSPSGHPNTNTQWSNTSDSTTIWMATSECHNGVWSDWQVVKIKGEKGDNGQSTFKSTVFTRTNETPLAPDATYGSYASPNPPESGSDMWPVKKSGGSVVSGTFWHDGIPAGEARLWASTRIFASDGQSPQQTAWTTPRQMTDTADFDVEFSSVDTPNSPSGHPNTNTQWSNTSDSTTIWMATSECHNGVWSDWQVVKIKGEKGEPGGKATGKVQWFLALGGSTRPAVPAVTIVNNVPKSTIGGQTVSWNEGSDPSWSETKKYLYEIDYFTLSDGTGYWSEPFFLSKWAEQGPQGEAAWAFSANPANVIITQSLDNNLTSFSSATVSFAATKGRKSATITSIAIPTGQQALSNEFNAAIGTGDDSKKVIVSSPKTHGTPAEYYTEGSFKVVVNAQAADGSTSSQEVTVLCYANLLGTWKREVVGDAEAVAAAKVEYIYDPNNPNQVVKMENFGNYVRSSTKNSAKLERDTTELVKNIANTAFDDIEGTQVALSAGEYIVQLNVDTEDLPTGNYVFDFAGFHYEGGEQFIEQRITVANSGTYTITLHDDVQSGTGVATMLYIGRVFNVSSEIKQTANNIMLQVNDKVSQSDFIIFSDSIQSSVKNISPSKNLLKGSLSAKGWLSSPSDIADSGVPYTSAKLDDDGYIVTTGNHQYLAQKLTLSGGKKYTLSFYSKKTTAITVTVWIVGYPTMKQAFTVAATDASVRKTVSIEIPLGFGGNMGISINATNIKQPQLEEGDTATDFIADSAEISSGIIQTADNIQLFVTQGLSNTGIDITNGNIDIVAGKVTFSYYDNGTKKSDKISINADTGTLKAVDVDLTGKITATSGAIGGFGITGSQISSLNNNIILKSDGYAKLGGFEVATNATASLKSTLTVGNKTSQRIEIIPFERNQVGSGTINFINADSYKVLKIGFYNDNYGAIDIYSPATNQNPEECAVSVRSNYLQISSENTDNGKESYITMLTSTNNAYSQYAFDDKVNKMFLTSGIEGGTLMLRAYKQNGSSAWPVCSLDPNGANWMDKGHVHVMTMAELKILLDNPDYTYSSHLANYAVMLTRINGN